VIVDDLDIEWAGRSIRPLEAKSPLVIDANAVLVFSVSQQNLEMVAGQEHQVIAIEGIEQNAQALFRLFLECMKLLDTFAVCESLSALVPVQWSVIKKNIVGRHGDKLP
jgi:hypothetical protein